MSEEPAAKLVDSTAHGGQVIGGSASVFVETLPAAHLTSPTICPQTTPVVHASGKVSLGSGAALTVSITKYPGAVVGSGVRCDGASWIPNAVTTGAGTVKYGVTTTLGGQPVVEQADGSITVGKIVIIGTPDYVAKVLGDLATGLSNETGRAWFEGAQDQPRPIVIYKGPLSSLSAQIDRDRDDPRIADGVGVETNIEYDPDAYDRSPGSTDPPDAALYHELGHVNNTTRGKYTPGNDGEDEEAAIIFGSGGGPSENQYRKHRGFPERKRHDEWHTPR